MALKACDEQRLYLTCKPTGEPDAVSQLLQETRDSWIRDKGLDPSHTAGGTSIRSAAGPLAQVPQGDTRGPRQNATHTGCSPLLRSPELRAPRSLLLGRQPA